MLVSAIMIMYKTQKDIKMSKIAVVGVEENLGREVLTLLAEKGIKVKDVQAVSPRSVMGNMISYGEDDEVDILNLEQFDFKSVEVAIFTTTAEIAKKYIPAAIKQGAKVIDASGSSAGNPDVAMVLSGFNDDKINPDNISVVSVPSPEVTQMLRPLQSLHQQFVVKRIVVSTYSSTSAYGRAGMDELFNQTRKIFMNDTLADDQNVFHKQIAFNVIPHLGEFLGEETICEWAFNAETKQILGGDAKVHANCAVVPAFIGSAQYINVEFAKEVDVDLAKDCMKKTKGIIVFDKQVDGGYVTLNDVQGEDSIYISRLRQDISIENGISFWCVADNLRSASAHNILSILNLLKK